MLRLRPYKKCDAKYIVSWIKDEDNFYPVTAFNEDGVVGHMILRFMDGEKKVLRFGFVIVDDAKRGCDYGKEMLQLAIKYAFEILKVEQVYRRVLKI